MRISELWLREWVNPPITTEQLTALLTMAGLEVDAVNPVAPAFDKVIVAEVIKIKPHPQADRLTLCEVSTGSDNLLHVVCGALNVRQGLKVALAQIGAHLPGGLVIKETKLRGELSQGMLCSAAELGLAENTAGIMELDTDAPVGMDLRTYLALDDQVFEVDLTPNRADCFSVLGVAREVAVLTDSTLQVRPSPVNLPTIDEQLPIHLTEAAACPQYYGRIIRNIRLGAETPTWMKERLRRAGLRSIHPVVDITNYVMMELGQPMHAFDLKAITKGINVRFAKSNEYLHLLDGQEVRLQENVLVIADEEKPLAMAGIMGGEESAVGEDTVDIFLESAFFNPLAIAGVARRYGLFTDSSQRFERGVDPALQSMALERVTQLLLDIVGGEAGPISFVTAASALPSAKIVCFNPAKVKRLTGLDVASDKMIQILQGLDMAVDSHDPLSWKVTVPSHRFDVNLEVDLVEEIIRIYGYDKLPTDVTSMPLQAGKTDELETLAMRMSQFFIARGYAETISYSFVDPKLQQAMCPEMPAMTLVNPISSELSQMRLSLWPGLLASTLYNIHRQQTFIKLFETGVVFDLQAGIVQEQACFGGLLTGEQGTMNWSETTTKLDFFDAKGDLQALFMALHLPPLSFVSSEHPALHPGKSARIFHEGKPVGWCGGLHPRLADVLDLPEEVILFELQLQLLVQRKAPRYRPLSKFPQIRRDLSFLVDNKVTAAQIEEQISELAPAEKLRVFEVFDVYTGKSIPDGKKSLAIALILQDDKQTMIDSEINSIMSAIIKGLQDKFAIILRD